MHGRCGKTDKAGRQAGAGSVEDIAGIDTLAVGPKAIAKHNVRIGVEGPARAREAEGATVSPGRLLAPYPLVHTGRVSARA